MADIDNFFTYLLDKMLFLNADSLVISADRKPSIMIGDTFRPVPNYEALSHEEIICDMEAIGINIASSGESLIFHTHIPGHGAPPAYFVIRYGYSTGKLSMEITRE